MEPMITVRDLTKHYGRVVAVDGLSFTLRGGEVTGFVGPNGAGKSTTMRVILGLARPNAGDALVNGRRYATLRQPLRTVGALLDASGTHPGRRACDHLLWMAHSNGLPASRVREVLELVGLARVARRRTGGFSLGMAQRLGIAAALLGDPPILLLDEPVNGLDPEGIRWFRGFARGLAAEGRLVLISSHLMGELEGTADRVIVIGRGRLLADAPVAELVARASKTGATLRTPEAATLAAVLADHGATVTTLDSDRLEVEGLAAERIAELAAGHGHPLHELSPRRDSLEEAYLALTSGAAEHRAAPHDEGRRRGAA